MEDNMDAVPDTEYRPYSPEQLACLVSLFRQAHGWSQETLAELAGVTPRTVQRVEAAEPTNLDTRRALARAFAIEDIDTFNRPHEMSTPDGAARAKQDFDRRFTVVETERADGRTLVTAIAASGPYRAIHTGAVGRPPREVEDLYARIADFLQDVMNVADVAGRVEVLGYGDEVEGRIAEMRGFGWELASGSRKVDVSPARLPTEITYVLAIPAGAGNRHVAVPKEPDN
jgi:transcriptional regulator with XRE-family HTH domain